MESQVSPFFPSHSQRNPFTAFFRFINLSIFLYLGLLTGCNTSEHYIEQHEIQHLKVVFLDQNSLHDEWFKRTGVPGTRLLPRMRGGIASFKTVQGFYDFMTETLYCPKWDFEVCGHELHHAVLGHFHAQE